MKKLMAAFLATGVVAGFTSFAGAATIKFDGNIKYDNEVVEIFFTLDQDSTGVNIWTDSYMNGTNFDPIAFLWRKNDNDNDFTLIGRNDDNSSIAPDQTVWDSGLTQSFLEAGEYLFTITRFPNWNNGSLFSEGFKLDNFIPSPLIGEGGFWRVNLEGVDSATSPVPEPATMALLGIGLVGLSARSRKKK